jgi:alkylhydroperoxidase family enzyme
VLDVVHATGAEGREVSQIAHDGAAALRGQAHLLQHLHELVLVEGAWVLGAPDGVDEVRDVAEDDGERVVDLVGHASRQMAHRGQALSLDQLSLRALELLEQ